MKYEKGDIVVVKFPFLVKIGFYYDNSRGIIKC